MPPRVSFVLAGVEDEVARESIARQTPPDDVEVIAVDAALGVAAARNAGLRRARGAYLCVLGGGSRLAPRYLAATLEPLEADPSLTWVSTWRHTSDEASWTDRPERCDLPALLAACTVHAPLVRVDAVRKAGGYDERVPGRYADEDLCIRLAEQGHRGRVVREALVLGEPARSPGMAAPEDDLAALRVLLVKHAASVRVHYEEVLALKDLEAARHLAAIGRVEAHVEQRLAPLTRAAREDAAALARRLADGEREADERAEARALRVALAAARHEAETLRRSLSWRITAPLRATWDVLHGRRPTR